MPIPKYRESPTWVLSAGELRAAIAEYDSRARETAKFLARARERGHADQTRFLVTSALLLDRQRTEFFHAQEQLRCADCAVLHSGRRAA